MLVSSGGPGVSAGPAHMLKSKQMSLSAQQKQRSIPSPLPAFRKHRSALRSPGSTQLHEGVSWLTCGSDGRARCAHSCKPVSEGAQGHAAEYEAPSSAAEARSCPFRLLLRLTFQQAGWLTELLTYSFPSFLPGLLSFWNG